MSLHPLFFLKLAFYFLFLSPCFLYSATITWTGTIDNQWNTSGNWSTSSIPTSSDEVIISGAFNVIVPSGTSVNAGSLFLQSLATLEIQSSATLSVQSLSVPTSQYSVRVEASSITNNGNFYVTGGIYLKDNSNLYNYDLIIDFAAVNNALYNFHFDNSFCLNATGAKMYSRDNKDPLGNHKQALVMLSNASFTNLGQLYNSYSTSINDFIVNGIIMKNGSTFNNNGGFINLNWIQDRGLLIVNDPGNTASNLFENNAPLRIRETDVNTNNSSIALEIGANGTYRNLTNSVLGMKFAGGNAEGFLNTTNQIVNNGSISYISSVASPFNPGSISLGSNAILAGVGPINNDLIDFQGGRVLPGSSPGVVSFTSPFSAGTATEFEMELAGIGGAGLPDGHDQVVFQSSPNDISNIDLKVIMINGYYAAPGDQFLLFDGTYSGTFNTIDLPGDDDSWSIIYNANNIILSLINPILNLGNTGFGTNNPSTKLHVKDGDVYLETPGSGIILRDANGDCRRIVIDPAGTVSTIQITCPQ